MSYDAYDVVIVPFPFTDRSASKRRPALVLSSAKKFGEKAAHSVLAMITSAKNDAWPLDVPLRDLESAGLPAASVVRMKLFTLDHRLILGSAGALSTGDRKAVVAALKKLLPV